MLGWWSGGLGYCSAKVARLCERDVVRDMVDNCNVDNGNFEEHPSVCVNWINRRQGVMVAQGLLGQTMGYLFYLVDG